MIQNLRSEDEKIHIKYEILEKENQSNQERIEKLV